jgi:hypothetical protein
MPGSHARLVMPVRVAVRLSQNRLGYQFQCRSRRGDAVVTKPLRKFLATASLVAKTRGH